MRSLRDLREEMRSVARGEREVPPLPARPGRKRQAARVANDA